MRYCIIFILIHWTILFPITLAVGGHPPAVWAVIELPTAIIYTVFGQSIYSIFRPNEIIPNIIIFIVLPTITYGLLGYVIGRRVNVTKGKEN